MNDDMIYTAGLIRDASGKPLPHKFAIEFVTPNTGAAHYEVFDTEADRKAANERIDKIPLKEAKEFVQKYHRFYRQFELGARRRTAEWNYTLDQGSVIKMIRSAGENIDIYVGGSMLGSGEIVIIEETVGVRITDFNEED